MNEITAAMALAQLERIDELVEKRQKCADVFSDFKISNKFVLSPSMLGHLILTPNPKHHPNGDFDLNNGLVECSIQKIASYTYSGMSVISPNLFRDMKDKIFPLEPILFEKASQGKLSGELHEGMWTDVGTKERLLNLEEFLSSNQVWYM